MIKKITLITIWLAALALANQMPAAQTNEQGEAVAQLAAMCRGPGKIRPDNNGKLLVVGREYTIAAQAGAGYVFTNWTDGYSRVLTNRSRLTFVMKPNAVFIANFVKRDHGPGRLAGLSTADVPLKFLAAIDAAAPAQREEILSDWLAEIAAVRPSALPSAVSTVVTAHPELLKIAVEIAVADGPAEVYGIVHAAALTPGANLTDIVSAACGSLPTQSFQIAQAVLNANPAAGRMVLQAVAATVPELATVIGAALNGTSPLTMNQTLQILAGALTQVQWPANPGPANQNPQDYSAP